MPRQPYVTIVFGKKGVGKTLRTINLIRDYVNISPRRKALIFDVNNEFYKFRNTNFKEELQNYDSVPTLRICDIAAFARQTRPELRRIRPYFDDGKKMSTSDMADVLETILEHFNNGLLLVEDINKYATASSMKQDIVGTLATSRHAGLDLIAHYQMIKQAASPTLVGMSNFFRVHLTQDTPYKERTKDNLQEKFEPVAIAYEIVKGKYTEAKISNEKIYYDVMVDTEKLLIKGKFTEKEAKKAIEKYILREKNEIRERVSMLDRNGKKMYKSYADAFSKFEQELFETYF